MMKVFVDGEAVIRGAHEFAPELIAPDGSERTRLNMARWLARYAEVQDCDVKLVFCESVQNEVLPPVEVHGRVKVRNLTDKEKMSREISAPANRAARSERVYVVTDNSGVQGAVKGSPVRAFTPEEFIRRARTVMGKQQNERYDEPDEKYSGVSEEEVDVWMEFFNDKDRD